MGITVRTSQNRMGLQSRSWPRRFKKSVAVFNGSVFLAAVRGQYDSPLFRSVMSVN